MNAIRFFCRICDRPLVCFKPGKRGRCPRCRARVRAPLGLAVSYQDAYGRVICERDWEPGEAEESLGQFLRPGGEVEVVGGHPSFSATELAESTDMGAMLIRIERKIDLVLDRPLNDNELPVADGVSHQLERIEKLVAASKVKETYTVEEAAAKLSKSPWVVRQWCNKGQVPGAYKIRTGRGKKGEWRLPHEAVVRLQNDGPSPLSE